MCVKYVVITEAQYSLLPILTWTWDLTTAEESAAARSLNVYNTSLSLKTNIQSTYLSVHGDS